MKELGKRILVFMILFVISSVTYAQITTDWSSSAVENSIGPAKIKFIVRDSTSRETLAGAFIRITDGQDTVKLVTNELGYGSLTPQFKSDSLEVTASYLGYKTICGKIPNIKALSKDLDVTINMPEDPQQINSIIVRDNAIAMVMHGDTTIFNSAAFTTRTGDVLKDLLTKLPGVKISGDKVTYLGRNIDRIIFNGDNMFGKDMNNAMRMVLADEVKSVKIYDKDAPDKIKDDPDENKERVMDVHTKVALKKVEQFDINAGAGVIPGGDAPWRSRYMAGLGSSFGCYAANNSPRYSGLIFSNHNASDSFSASSNPTDNINGNFSTGKDIPGKKGWNHNLIFSYDKLTNYSGNIKIYEPSTQWTERRDSSNSTNFNKTKTLKYIGTSYFLKGRNRYRMFGSLSYSKVTGRNENQSVSRSDDNVSKYDKLIGNSSSNFLFSFQFIWSKTTQGGLYIHSTASFTGQIEAGDGQRIDTTFSTMSREWLVNSLSNRTYTPSIATIITKTLSSKSRILFSAKSIYNYTSATSLYTNMFSGQIIQNNSIDYRQNNLINGVSTEYRYGKNYSGLYLSANLGFKHILNIRNEKLDNVTDMTRNYFRPDIEAEIQYNSGEQRFELSYSESESIPSANQLRPVIEDSDPLNLFAGNPDLKLSVKRDAALSASRSFAEKNIILSFSALGSLRSNEIVSKTTYFSESTYLPIYNYTAESGSSIILPVNINGSISGNANFEFQKYLKKIKSNLKASIAWNMDRSPFYLADIRHCNLNNSIHIKSYMNCNINNLSLNFIPSVTLGKSRMDGKKVYDYITPGMSTSASLRLFDHLELSGDMTADRMFATKTDAGYSNILLDLKIGWLFGKDNRCKVEIFSKDLLNNVKHCQTSKTDNYTMKNWADNFGKSFGFKFAYVFSRR